MEESSDSKQYRETAIAIGGFALGIVLAAAFTHIPGSPADWAAWVQAIGSLVAIGIAIYVPYAQRRNSEREKRFDHARRLRIATQAVRFCIDFADAWIAEIEFSKYAEKMFSSPFNLPAFERLVAVLDSVEIHNLPTTNAFTLVTNATYWARMLSNTQQAAKEEVESQGVVSKKSEAEIRKGHGFLTDNYNKLLNECIVVETGLREQGGHVST